MAAVAALADADVMLILTGKVLYDIPRLVLAAVVDEEDAAVAAYLPRRGKRAELVKEHGRGNGQNGLLIIARDDDI